MRIYLVRFNGEFHQGLLRLKIIQTRAGLFEFLIFFCGLCHISRLKKKNRLSFVRLSYVKLYLITFLRANEKIVATIYVEDALDLELDFKGASSELEDLLREQYNVSLDVSICTTFVLQLKRGR